MDGIPPGQAVDDAVRLLKGVGFKVGVPTTPMHDTLPEEKPTEETKPMALQTMLMAKIYEDMKGSEAPKRRNRRRAEEEESDSEEVRPKRVKPAEAHLKNLATAAASAASRT